MRNKFFPQITQIFAEKKIIKNICVNLRNLWATPQKTSVLICAICGLLTADAQKTITLNAALDSAIANNLTIKNETLKSAYTNALIKTATDIPKTNVLTEFGQVNSPLFDMRFGVSQSIQFPTVYKKQKELLAAENNTQSLNKDLKVFELKKVITQTFYQYYSLKNKEQLLIKSDSLYIAFYSKALLRLQKGESNVLEKTTAETQQANIALQLKQVKQELESTIIYLQYLTNTTTQYIPSVTTNTMYQKFVIDTSALQNHPLLKLLQQQALVQKNKTNLEQERLKPDINLGIYNTSFTGVAADNKEYKLGNRFTSVQLGLGFSIFNQSQKAKIKSSKIAEQIASNEANNAQQQLQISMQRLLTACTNNLDALKYFETEGLKNAATIKTTASKQFINGEINYLDYVMLLNNAISIESNYLNTLQEHNNIVIEINFINK